MERARDEAAQGGGGAAIYQLVNGKRRERQPLAWTPESERLAQSASAAQRLAREREVERKETSMETVATRARPFALAVEQRLSSKTKSTIYRKLHVDSRLHATRKTLTYLYVTTKVTQAYIKR